MSDQNPENPNVPSSADLERKLMEALGKRKRQRRMAIPLPTEEQKDANRRGPMNIFKGKKEDKSKKDKKPKKEESDKHLRLREAKLIRLAQPAQGCKIVIASQQGGSGKTTLAVILSVLMARHHHDSVGLLEVNPGGGAVSLRLGVVPMPTVVELYRALPNINSLESIQEIALQGAEGLDLIATDDNLALDDWVQPDQFEEVLLTLEKHYSVIIADTPTSFYSPYTAACLSHATQLVVCCTTDAESSLYLLSSLDYVAWHHPFLANLINNAVVVAHEVREGTQVEFESTINALKEKCRAVIVIPFNSLLAEGGAIDFEDLDQGVMDRYMDVAADAAFQFADVPN